jgi:hypothetical protein
MIFCKACARNNQWDTPPVRISKDPCDICGGYDKSQKRNKRTGELEPIDLPNYSGMDLNLEGTAAHTKIQAGVQ